VAIGLFFLKVILALGAAVLQYAEMEESVNDLVSSLAIDHSTVYFNQPDADRTKSGIPLDNFLNFARLNGFSENDPKPSMMHPKQGSSVQARFSQKTPLFYG
jgi:hypothetical protein